MSTGLARFRASNHPQQLRKRGPAGSPGLGLVPDAVEVDDRTTPPEVFGRWHEQFAFTVDVAASDINARLPRFYTVEDDGLAQSWAGERVWCNPPYSDIRPWVAKAWAEPEAFIVMLLPANRTELDWWQELVEPHRDRPGSRLRVEFLAGRQRFILPGRTTVRPNERPPFGVCLLIWEVA